MDTLTDRNAKFVKRVCSKRQARINGLNISFFTLLYISYFIPLLTMIIM